MATSFVSLKGDGFWMYDSTLELFLRLAALHIEDQVNEGSIAHKIRDEWLLASRGYFNGAVPLSLDSYAQSADGKNIVVSAIQSLLEALKSSPSFIDSSGLNIMGMSGDFVDGFETSRLIEAGESFIALIKGSKFGGPSNTAYMPGCGAA